MAYAVQAVWFHNSDYVPAEGRNITGPKFFGLDLRSRVGTDYPRIEFCLLVLGVLVIVVVSVALLRRSRLGSACPRSAPTSGPPPAPASTLFG